jgi:hypothetical protein
MSRQKKFIEITADELQPGKIYKGGSFKEARRWRFVKKDDTSIAFEHVPKHELHPYCINSIDNLVHFPLNDIFYRLCTILLILCLCCSTFGQYDRSGKLLKTHKVVSDKARFIALATTSIILNGIGDGLNTNPKTKPAGHIVTAAAIGTLVSMPLLTNFEKKKWYIYLLSYSFLRAGLFDATYNTTRGLPLGYNGNSCLWDKFWTKSGGKGFLFPILCISVGVALPIDEL